MPALRRFWESSIPRTKKIILTGAGTSAFIGLNLRGCFQQMTGIPTEAVATTDIVSHPHHYFLPNEPLLLISFARSGNSPESAAAIALADDICQQCHHLIITCNREGALVQQAPRSTHLHFFLPPQANDISLAMTSSYSGMLLTGLLFAHINELSSTKTKVQKTAAYASRLINSYAALLKETARLSFNRVVFLGAGPLAGTATEASLKMLELTDGKVVSRNDTYLGFRHGPKSIIDAQTLVVYFLSSANTHSRQYETDLVQSIKKGTAPLLEIGVAETRQASSLFTQQYFFNDEASVGDENFLALPYIIVAQLLGFYKSLQLHLKPDSPSVNNDITRVVEGVTIYNRV
ncbi:MAG TPA: SIS domain-containing protein [Flavihumibacter sp.]|nr:SIS domain-containing protein [Flavihumibacter sp.]